MTDHSDLETSVYNQLHRIADAALANEAAGHSLQPTLLVNDAYLRLRDQRNVDASDRVQVLAAGANIIRRLLVDYARKRKARKRGGAEGRGEALQVDVAENSTELDMLELHESLDSLHEQNPRAAKVVELRFFGGLQGDEIAEQLGVSERTVKSDWRFAKAWLYRALGTPDE